MTTFYKTLRTGRIGTHHNYTWPEPGTWTEPIDGPLVACENGYHVVTADQLLTWLSDEVWEVEVEDAQPADGKWVCRRARLIRRVMGEREVRLFAADCAEAVLHLFEAERPGDDRPRKAVAAARARANGEIDAAAWAAARAAARAAAWDAAWDAAWAAAWDAARAWDAQTQRLTQYLNGEAE